MQIFFRLSFCQPVCPHITAREPQKYFHGILELGYLTKTLLMRLSFQLDPTVFTPHYL
jgi:hypothetical protein